MPEVLVEGVVIALACGALAALSRAFKLAFFGQGVLAASIALVLCWTLAAIIVLLSAGPVSGLGLLLLIVFPAIEEAVRVIFVYTRLPEHELNPSRLLLFSAGYASVEALYKPILILSLSAGQWHYLSPGMLLLGFLTPGSALLFLGLVAAVFQSRGVPISVAFFVGAALHSGHNIVVQTVVAGSSRYLETSVLVGAGYGLCSVIAFYLIRRGPDKTQRLNQDLER